MATTSRQVGAHDAPCPKGVLQVATGIGERALTARIAANTRWSKDKQSLDQDRAELATLQLERKIRETIAAAPPLTDEQRNRLRTLLNG